MIPSFKTFPTFIIYYGIILFVLLSQACAPRGPTLTIWENPHTKSNPIEIQSFEDFYKIYPSANSQKLNRDIQQNTWIKKSDKQCDGFLSNLDTTDLNLNLDPEYFGRGEPLFLNVNMPNTHGFFKGYLLLGNFFQKSFLKNLKNFDPHFLGDNSALSYLSIPTKTTLASPTLPDWDLTKNSLKQTLKNTSKYLDFNEKIINNHPQLKKSPRIKSVLFSNAKTKIKKLRDLIQNLKDNSTGKPLGLLSSTKFLTSYSYINNQLETIESNINASDKNRNQQIENILKLASIQFNLRLDQIALQLIKAESFFKNQFAKSKPSTIPKLKSLFRQRLHAIKMTLEEQVLLESYLEIALKIEKAFENKHNGSEISNIKSQIEKHATLALEEIIRINRGKSISKILKKQEKPIEGYPFEAAYKDILQYHRTCGADKEGNTLVPDYPLDEVFKTALEIVRSCGYHKILPEPIHKFHFDPSIKELTENFKACLN